MHNSAGKLIAVAAITLLTSLALAQTENKPPDVASAVRGAGSATVCKLGLHTEGCRGW